MDRYSELLTHELLSPSEERHLLTMAHKGCQQSRERLILLNMRLVGWICSKYETETVSAEALMGDGVEGLIKAIDGFDLTLGTRLSTYATIGIHTAVGRSPVLQATIQHPENILQPMRQMKKVMADLASQGNHSPSNEDIAEKMGKLNPQEVAHIRLLAETTLNVASIHAPIQDDDGNNQYVVDFVQYDDPAFEQIALETDLDFFLSKLQQHEAFVLKRSYGIPREMTNIEIAEALRTHRNKIPKIRECALRQCQRIAEYIKSEGTLTGCENWKAIMVDPKIIAEPDGKYQMEFNISI
ncbi:MAG: sigma-70 family RNA polymerase sigma factor [Candidatus Poribacteria bacterium]|nr:sigma-70 family RNA polymerase sigma factor [Candidatus Poribacteria bacterium]